MLRRWLHIWHADLQGIPASVRRKSTLARGLAAYWFALGRKPALIDADPTATLSKRYNPQGKLGAVPVIAEPEELVAQVIEQLRAQPPESLTAVRPSDDRPMRMASTAV